MKWHNKNLGKSPFDPDYIDDYDAEQDFERYCEACEEREQAKRENGYYGPNQLNYSGKQL